MRRVGEDPFEVGQLVRGVELGYQVCTGRDVSLKGGKKVRRALQGRTCQAGGVVADTVAGPAGNAACTRCTFTAVTPMSLPGHASATAAARSSAPSTAANGAVAIASR